MSDASGWELRLSGASEAAHVLEGLFEARGTEVDLDAEGRLVASFDDAPDLSIIDALGAWLRELDLPPVEIETRRAGRAMAAWEPGWRAVFEATRISPRLWLRPVWDAAAPGRLELVIDPNHAFGGGFHPTTLACADALDAAIDGAIAEGQPTPTVLDVGTGNGILAIAAALLGATAVGIEIDGPSCDEARENATLNGVAERVHIVHGLLSDLASPATSLPPRYDIVIANILAQFAVLHAAALKAACARDAILSGISDEKADAVLAAWSDWTLVSRRSLRGWTTLHLRRA